jgi:hypothetical protein
MMSIVDAEIERYREQARRDGLRAAIAGIVGGASLALAIIAVALLMRGEL